MPRHRTGFAKLRGTLAHHCRYLPPAATPPTASGRSHSSTPLLVPHTRTHACLPHLPDYIYPALPPALPPPATAPSPYLVSEHTHTLPPPHHMVYLPSAYTPAPKPPHPPRCHTTQPATCPYPRTPPLPPLQATPHSGPCNTYRARYCTLHTRLPRGAARYTVTAPTAPFTPLFAPRVAFKFATTG